MTTFQKIAVTAVLTVTLGASLYEAKQAASARAEAQMLQTQQTAQATEIAKLRTEDSQLSNLVAQAKEQKQLTAAQFSELLKLRGQATADQRATELENDPAVQKAQVWMAKEKKIRDQFELHPEQKIPEMQFLTEEDWLDHARHAEVDTENGMRIAMSNIRATAGGIFAGKMSQAIALYLADHQQKLPDSAADLADYFHPPLKDADALLSRYVRPPANPDVMIYGSPQLFQQNPATVIDPIDSLVTFNSNTVTWMPGTLAVPLPDELEPVAKAFTEAHHRGFLSVYDLKPFATTPEQKTALEKLIEAVNPNR